MTIPGNLKTQLNSISEKVSKAEKLAEKRIKQVLKSTETFRTQQLKNVQQLLKRARTLKEANLVKRAEKVKKEIEVKAAEGVDLLLSKLNMPTRKDLERLSKKVSSLQKRLEEVEKK